MNDMNELKLQGNVTRMPELKQVSEKARVTSFSIATHRYFVKERNEAGQPTSWGNETSFVDVDCWNKVADDVFNGVCTGDKVTIFGRLKQDRWEDQNTGDNRGRLKVVATAFDLVSKVADDVA